MSTELHCFASGSRSEVETPLQRRCILLAWSIRVYSDPSLTCCKSRSPNPLRTGWVLKPGLVNNRTKREWAFWGSTALQDPSVARGVGGRGWKEICLIIIEWADGWKTNTKKTYYCIMFGLDAHTYTSGMMGKTSSERMLYVFLYRNKSRLGLSEMFSACSWTFRCR